MMARPVPTPLPIADTLRGREILMTGASGFVGKVWLVMLLDRVPDIGRVHVLLRENGDGDARARFEKIANTSPAFAPLHRTHGENLSAFLAEKVVPHTGDVTLHHAGLDPAAFPALDLVLHCAAVVDFDPDTRHALRSNVNGALHVAEFAHAVGARMVHVGTCFVAGRRPGRVEETPRDTCPNGDPFDPETELATLEAAIAKLATHHASAAFEAELRDAARAALIERGAEPTDDAIAARARRARTARVDADWVEVGRALADARGWPNTYTYTKAITEGVLRARFPDMPLAVVRPAVVESALAFPEPGWNEGFNTCSPLAYLIGTWFKALPGKKDNPFDVVPVDFVATAITIAACALLRDEAQPVYQCGTAYRNRLTLGRAAELTALGQRRWLRKNGDTFVDRVIKSRSDTTVFERSHPLSIEQVDAWMERTAERLRDLPTRTPDAWQTRARKAAFKLDRNRRTARRVRTTISAFMPFIRDIRQTFEASNLERHAADDPRYAWAPERLDWRRYWLDVHMPGMRKWSFPLFDGEEPPQLASPVTVDLSIVDAAE